AGPTGRPRPRSLSQRITPSAAPSPKAEPPVSRTASMRSTTWRGFSASSSRVPVARPRTAQAARIPLSGPSTTLQPVARSRSVQCPTEIPRTVVRPAGAEDAMGGRSIARLARVVEGTYVSAMPNPDPQSPPTTVLVVDDEDGTRTAAECLTLGAHDYLSHPVDRDELELSLQSGLLQRQLEIDRRELEQWRAREVAVRTRDLEERTTVVEDVALTALAAAGDWPGA